MSEEKAPSLPGPKKKQAQALSQNIRWLGETFGLERIGFLTLTCGDETPDGFKKVTSRAEASRRYHSLHNTIRSRYQCGVIVTERHKDGGIHFHLVVVVGGDIKSGVDFDACFPKRENGKPVHAPCYDTATPRLKLEWKFWREASPRFGFGRHNLQPCKANAEALGFYVGKYISKSWEARCPDDKGGRLVRYFGNWRAAGDDINPRTGKPFRFSPPHYAQHGTLTAWARAWRECAKQSALLCQLDGFNLTERNIKKFNGAHWALDATRRFNRHEFFVRGDEKLKEALEQHNAEANADGFGRHVGHSRAEHWLRCEDWHAAELENERQRLAALREWEKNDGLRESLHTWPTSISGHEAAISTGSSSSALKKSSGSRSGEELPR